MYFTTMISRATWFPDEVVKNVDLLGSSIKSALLARLTSPLFPSQTMDKVFKHRTDPYHFSGTQA